MHPLPLARDPRQHGASVLVRYFMIPCNVCLILLAAFTLGLALALLGSCTCEGRHGSPPSSEPLPTYL